MKQSKKTKKALLLIIISAAFLIILLGLPSIVQKIIKPIKCNGHAKLCNRPLNEVVFATTHNAMSIADYDWFGPSHEHSITSQLNSGIRALMLDTHYFDAAKSISSYFPDANQKELLLIQKLVDATGAKTKGGTYVCHIICQLGSTPLVKTLKEIGRFLKLNSNEVIVIIFEDKISVADTEKAMRQSGVLPYLYSHTNNKPWPTLKELISQNKRLMVMAEVEGPPPSWYHHVWDYVEETPYSFEDVEAMSCISNRGGTNKSFFLLNHWIEKVTPSRIDAKQINEYDFLLKRAQKCAQERNHEIPNFIAVNFHNLGGVIKVVDKLNETPQN